jgi:glycosyltransferase involved in cell wall biosynthesis
MRILFLARATLYSVYGGDTIQILSTAKFLNKLGVHVDVKLVNDEKIDYSKYDLLHLFNIIRPADFLNPVKESKKPYVVSTIFVEYNEYQQNHSRGIVSFLSKYFSSDQMEYAKAVGRWIKNGESINSIQYMIQGHRQSIQQLARGAAYLLPNSRSEYNRFVNCYHVEKPYKIINNGVDTEIFSKTNDLKISKPDSKSVICVSRIEGQKNHLNLIMALNDTPFHLLIIGKYAPNHKKYYEQCRDSASSNITFSDFVPQEKLFKYYSAAKVHALPSWNETCGLSSLEAAYYNCNLVITDKGDTVEYFGDNAWYCDPGDPGSIYEAVVRASEAPPNISLREKISSTYNWNQAAIQTLSVYEEVLNRKLLNGSS